MIQYYIIKNGQQEGPFLKEALRFQGITPDTYVWRQGLQDWVKASGLPELSEVFADESAFGAYARQEPPQYPPYNRQSPGFPPPENPWREPIEHTNWMPWAIVGTVVGAFFSCIGMIFGIIGMTQASKANKYYAMGEEHSGNTANSSARTMTVIALVLALVGLVLTLTGVTREFANNLTTLTGNLLN